MMAAVIVAVFIPIYWAVEIESIKRDILKAANKPVK